MQIITAHVELWDEKIEWGDTDFDAPYIFKSIFIGMKSWGNEQKRNMHMIMVF